MTNRGMLLASIVAATMASAVALAKAETVIYPAPEGEPLSQKFSATVDGKNLPVYGAKVAHSNPNLRFRNMDDKAHSGEFYEEAGFAYFDLDGTVRISITCPQKVESATILPASFGINPIIEGSTVSFNLNGPAKLTVEVNGSPFNALHLFANPPEKNIPAPGNPQVLYYGPGIHEVDNVHVPSNTTVYVAGGAIVRGKANPAKSKGTTFTLEGDNIIFRGRGIVDGSLSPIHSRHLLFVKGTNIRVEGVILRDSSIWTVPIRQSSKVDISNLKLLGYRANSDGIDICNSRDVTIRDCFIRTLDDLVVIKTDKDQGKSGNILVEKCILWNEVAHALSVGAELREDVDGVTFRDCDVIHDFGREWTLRVFHCDAATIRNVLFENIRVADSPRLISLWIDKAVWSRDENRGQIDGVIFRNISLEKGKGRIELKGYDDDHRVKNVYFENVVLENKPLVPASVLCNPFVENVTVIPVPPGQSSSITVKNF